MGHSLKQRLHAWWEGYELTDQPEAASGVDGGVADVRPVEDATQGPPRQNIISADRMEFLQRLWGAGQCRPGTLEDYRTDRKVLILNDSTTVAEFGCGFGTAARIMAGDNICYVDAYENDPLLVDLAKRTKATGEQQKFVSYNHVPLNEVPEGRKYSRIVFNRYLHRMLDPLDMVRAARALLKEDGQILLTEYTAGSGGALPDSTQAVMDGFGAPRPLISRDVYGTAFADMGLVVRVSEDRTAQHLGHIAHGWKEMNAILSGDSESVDISAVAAMLKDETTRWVAISTALKKRQLEYSRILITMT